MGGHTFENSKRVGERGGGEGGGGQNMAEIIPGPFGDVAIDVKTKVALQKR